MTRRVRRREGAATPPGWKSCFSRRCAERRHRIASLAKALRPRPSDPYLADPRKHGENTVGPADLGLDLDALRRHLSFYQERCRYLIKSVEHHIEDVGMFSTDESIGAEGRLSRATGKRRSTWATRWTTHST
jgi:hypothetical protein